MSAEHTVELSAAPDAPRARILSRGTAPSIAYHRRAGKAPGVLFITGFMSDMAGSKATALDAFCAARGQAFVRFDYRGHGQSDGVFEDADIGTWLADALDVFDSLTEGPQVLVGTSMGGWIMLLLAQARPERIKGLVGIAAAPDFTEWLSAAMTAEHRLQLERAGKVIVPSMYGDNYIFTSGLIESGKTHRLLHGRIKYDGPVRLLQGTADHAVPWQTAIAIQNALTSTDVDITLIKDGDHRLSTPVDIARLTQIVGDLSDR
jgi:pimeloyl-ACP methyl ester carboxylesterase